MNPRNRNEAATGSAAEFAAVRLPAASQRMLGADPARPPPLVPAAQTGTVLAGRNPAGSVKNVAAAAAVASITPMISTVLGGLSVSEYFATANPAVFAHPLIR